LYDILRNFKILFLQYFREETDKCEWLLNLFNTTTTPFTSKLSESSSNFHVMAICNWNSQATPWTRYGYMYKMNSIPLHGKP